MIPILPYLQTTPGRRRPSLSNTHFRSPEKFVSRPSGISPFFLCTAEFTRGMAGTRTRQDRRIPASTKLENGKGSVQIRQSREGSEYDQEERGEGRSSNQETPIQ